MHGWQSILHAMYIHAGQKLPNPEYLRNWYFYTGFQLGLYLDFQGASSTSSQQGIHGGVFEVVLHKSMTIWVPECGRGLWWYISACIHDSYRYANLRATPSSWFQPMHVLSLGAWDVACDVVFVYPCGNKSAGGFQAEPTFRPSREHLRSRLPRCSRAHSSLFILLTSRMSWH